MHQLLLQGCAVLQGGTDPAAVREAWSPPGGYTQTMAGTHKWLPTRHSTETAFSRAAPSPAQLQGKLGREAGSKCQLSPRASCLPAQLLSAWARLGQEQHLHQGAPSQALLAEGKAGKSYSRFGAAQAQSLGNMSSHDQPLWIGSQNRGSQNG